MKKVVSLTLIMLIIFTSFTFAYAKVNNFEPKLIVETGNGTFLSWGAVTTTHYYCNKGDNYAGVVLYIDTVGTMRVEIFKVGSSSPLATHTVNGPYNGEFGEGIGITVDTAGYYYVKFTNTGNSVLDVYYAVIYN